MNAEIKQLELFRDLPDEIITAVKKSSQGKAVFERCPHPVGRHGMYSGVFHPGWALWTFHDCRCRGANRCWSGWGKGRLLTWCRSFRVNRSIPADAKTVSPAQLLVIDRKDFQRLLDSYPPLLRALTAYLSKRLLSMVDLAERLALFPVRQRLAAFLINQADTVGEDVAQRWTQEDIARRLGTVRDVVGRALRKFEQEGLIRFQRERIQLLDREKLQSLADGRE